MESVGPLYLGAFSREDLFFSGFFFLTACTDRQVEISFLSTILSSKVSLKITNALNESDILPNIAGDVPMDISCGNSVKTLEIQEPATQDWKSISDVVSGGAFLDCANQSELSVVVPISYLAPYAAPVAAGDIRKNFQIRWTAEDLKGAPLVYYQTLAVLFKAPLLSASVPHVNIANIGANMYTVTGTCSENTGSVKIVGVFSSDAIVSCAGNIFSVTGTVDPSLTDGTKTVSVRHYVGTSYRAYAQKDAAISVDRSAPSVTVSSPADGSVFNSASFASKNTVTVTGLCSEALREVSILVSGSAVTSTVTCSAAGTFQAEILLPQGVSTIGAAHSDLAGNSATSALIPSVTKDTTPPGSFSVSGLHASSGLDATVDAVLGDIDPVVTWTNATGAVKYDISIYNNADQEVCAKTSIATSPVIFVGCVLSQSTSYKVKIKAYDFYDNTITASNQGYAFTTQFPIPKVTRIYTDSGYINGQYKTGVNIPIYLEFDRAISLTGTARILLNSTALVDSIGIEPSTSSRVIRFNYVVAATQNVNKLMVQSLTMSSGSIKDLNNSVVTASLALTADSGTDGNLLGSNNIQVDTTAPSSVTGLSLRDSSCGYYFSPTITYTPPSGEPVTVYAQVVERVPPRNWLVPWGIITSGTMLSLSGNLQPGTMYDVEYYTKDGAGNVSATQIQTFTSYSCPSTQYTYAIVNGSPLCIGTYESKDPFAGLFES